MDWLLKRLNELHAAGNMHGFSIWPSQRGFQASIAMSAPNSFRIRHGDTPSDAVNALFDMTDPDDEILPEQPLLAAREVFEPELPEPEDSVFD